MPIYDYERLERPDLSKISPERKEILSKNKYFYYFKYGLEKYSNEEYLYWDKIKFKPVPEELESHEELWYIIKECRSNRYTPIVDNQGTHFVYNKVDFLDELLHDLDMKLGGNFFGVDFTENERKKYLQNGIVDEAISSSQIEGALTSSKVARDMIARKRKPVSKDERMILNNYKAMNYVTDELKKTNLDLGNLLELQSMLVDGTLENPDEKGRFRKDSDQIIVQDKLTGKVLHVPPEEAKLMREVDRFIKYANDEDGVYTHPFIKAILLHFWIGYIHPFCDGNGRTARAVFYWYLIKKGYWGFSYIPISRAINDTKKQYGQAYLYSEQDGNDLTYFIVYLANKTRQSITDFQKYLEHKRKENSTVYHELQHLQLNERQNDLIRRFLENPTDSINASIHMRRYKVVFNTARRDLKELQEKSLVTPEKRGAYLNYRPVVNLAELVKNPQTIIQSDTSN